MRSKLDVLCIFGLFLPKFGCHGNSLGSLKILGSIFEIADPEKPTIHAKFVSISCTEMKLCLFECLAYLYHCRYRQFSFFCQKNCRNCWKFLIKPIKGTRIHGNTSYELLTTFVRRTMRSRQDVSFNFGSFLPKFGCHSNSLSSLKILDSILEIADPENPTIHAKFVSISCTEMKLCLFECLAYLCHCRYRQFSRFFAKNSRNCWKFLIKPIKALEFTETRLMSHYRVCTTNNAI